MFNQKRLKSTFIAFFILLAFVLFDIFQLQTTEFQSTSEIIDQQNLDKFYITAPRGEIFDANGEKIAETKLEPHLFINMRKITNQNSASYTQIIQYNFPDLTTREINKIYQKELGNLFYSFQEEQKTDRSNMWLTCALMKGEYIPQDLIDHLAKDNIEARRIWKPMHEQPVMKSYRKYINGNSSLLFSQGICLPSGSDLTDKDLKRIIKSIKTFFNK